MAGLNHRRLRVSHLPGEGLFFVLLHMLPSLSALRVCKIKKTMRYPIDNWESLRYTYFIT